MLDPAPDLSDTVLGDRALGSRSYEEHYVEHAPAARRLALSMVPPDVADDIVAEAFARVLAAIRAGGGPRHAFRGYLLAAVRNLACDWLQARGRLTVVGDMDVQADDEPAGPGRVNPGIGCAADTQAEARDEARLVTRAFGRLPARWRAVLWQLEVEGKAPAAVAPMFGLSANGVSALAMRAREGLRQAYLAEHVGSNIPAACRTYAAEFGAGARGRLSQRRRASIQEHLSHCPACQDLFTELTELNSRLGTILTPAALAAASSALGSAKRAAILRTTLTGHWRTWRWHPVTTVTGAAAGVAVAGGMLLAVNVTPLTSTPAHAAAEPAVQTVAPSGSSARKREPGGGSAGGGAASTVARSGPAAPAGPGSSAGSGSLTAAAPPPGATAAALPGGSVTGAPAAGPAQTRQAPSSAGTPNAGTATTSASGNLTQTVTSTAGATVTGLANTAGTTVTGLANTAGTTVTGLANTVGTTVTGLANTVGATVTGVTDAASGLVSAAAKGVTGVTSTATNAVTGVASTANATVTTAGSTVSNVASTTTATVASTASAAASTASTATTAVTGLASAAAANL